MFDFANQFLRETKQDFHDVLKDIEASLRKRASVFNKMPGNSDKKKESKFFSDFLPYCNFDSENFVFENKTTYAGMLQISPFSGIDQKAVNVLTQVISYDIPDGAIIQIMNFASPDIESILDTWKDVCNKPGIYKHLSKKRKDFYMEGRDTGLLGKASDCILRNFQIYLSISFSKKQSKDANRELINTIVEVRKKTIRALNNVNCNVKILDNVALEQLQHQMLFAIDQNAAGNASKAQDLPSILEDYEYLMYPHYFESFLKHKNQAISIKKYLVFEVEDWPKAWSITDSINYVGNFQTGRGLGFPFYINYGFKIEDHRESDRKATKMRMLRINQTTSKLAAFFPAMLEEIEDWQLVSEEISKGARLTKAVMQIIIILDPSLDVQHAESAVKDHFYQLGFKINQVKYDILNNFISTLPMSMAEHWPVFTRQKVLSTLLTSSCVNLLPLFADCQNYDSPLMMFSGRRGQIFFFDNFQSTENGNYNMVVVGKSGSGKSVFLQEYMTSILRMNGQVVVIDDGRSFQNSCAILSGDFIDFAGQNLCINPFSLYQAPEVKDEKFKVDFEEPLIDLIVSILCIITNIDKNNTKDFDTGLYRDILKKAVQVVLEEKSNAIINNVGIREVRDALLTSAELRTEQTKDIADKLSFMLKEYADGRYSCYYNGRATLSLKNLLTVFELSSLESNEILQTSVLLMVVFLVYIKNAR
jgi:conjugal transfer ATP-binding protein TraC